MTTHFQFVRSTLNVQAEHKRMTAAETMRRALMHSLHRSLAKGWRAWHLAAMAAERRERTLLKVLAVLN